MRVGRTRVGQMCVGRMRIASGGCASGERASGERLTASAQLCNARGQTLTRWLVNSLICLHSGNGSSPHCCQLLPHRQEVLLICRLVVQHASTNGQAFLDVESHQQWQVEQRRSRSQPLFHLQVQQNAVKIGDADAQFQSNLRADKVQCASALAAVALAVGGYIGDWACIRQWCAPGNGVHRTSVGRGVLMYWRANICKWYQAKIDTTSRQN